ncbi:MAG: lipase [Ruminococcaceae bacterium]|nr:lipase [Oscillospiraceae bacterium]
MKRILCFGDSNTFGYDPRSYFGSQYPANVRWTGLLQAAGFEVANCGQNGLSIPREAHFPAVADMLRRVGAADVVTVMLGSNDLLGGASAEDAAARMETLLRCLSARSETGRLLLIAPPPMQPGDWVQSRAVLDASTRLAEAYRVVADSVGAAFADAGAWNVALTFDGVHFSPEGHASFARGLIKTLAALTATL